MFVAISNEINGLNFEPSPLLTVAILGYTACKPKGPVIQTASPVALASPNDKRAFVTSKFLAMRILAQSLLVSGGMSLSVRLATRLQAWFEHPAHLMRFKPHMVASLDSPVGTKTMTAITRAHITAPTSPQANTAQEAIAAHIGIHNALSMATWHIAKGNTPAAARKVRQALAALRQLDKLEG